MKEIVVIRELERESDGLVVTTPHLVSGTPLGQTLVHTHLLANSSQ
jgi:hypothetical protein